MNTKLVDEPSAKSCCGPDCCAEDSADTTATAGSTKAKTPGAETPTADRLKSEIKDRYGRIAAGAGTSSCCGPSVAGKPNCGCATDDSLQTVSLMMNETYESVDDRIVEAADLGLGCGTPLAFADMTEGMRVLDLGSGAGIDVFLAAKKVGPTGKAIGLDMTDEMLALARRNRATLGIENAEFLKGEIEDMPVESNTVDRILSNCVINLVPDKRRAFAEMHRVLKPGGRFTISDIVSIGRIPDAVRADMELWAGCVAGALDRDEYLGIVKDAGFTDLTIAAEKPYSLDKEVPFGLESMTLTAQK
jgi:arsenite methyltransferase